MLLRGLRAAWRKATALYDDAVGKAAGNPNIKVRHQSGQDALDLVATAGGGSLETNSRPSRLRVTVHCAVSRRSCLHCFTCDANATNSTS